MGKISNMQQKQNKENGVNLSYARSQAKPRFKIKGIKDVSLLYKPGIEKEYDFYPEEKKFIRALRVGTLSLAALASAAAITVGASHVVNPTGSAPTHTEQEMSNLTKEDVVESAENALLDFIYQDSSSALRDRAFITYKHDEASNMDKLTVYDRFQDPNKDPSVHFTYRRYNNAIDQVITKSNKNDPEIDELLNCMIDVYLKEDPTREELGKLFEKSSSLDFSRLKFDGKTIVDKSVEKDMDENER